MLVDKNYFIIMGRTTSKNYKKGISYKIGDTIEVSAQQLVDNGSGMKIEYCCNHCSTVGMKQASKIKDVNLCASCSSKNRDISNRSGGDNKGDKNPAWNPNKTPFELYEFECNVVKKHTIKEQNITYVKGEGIYFKIGLKTAFKIGMSPEFVGARLIVIENIEATSFKSIGNNHGIHQKTKSRICNTSNILKFSTYRNRVSTLTNHMYEKHKEIINPLNTPRGKQGINNDNYQVDHIVPVSICWDNGISAENCASLENLRMLHWRDNISKNDRLTEEGSILLNKLNQQKEVST